MLDWLSGLQAKPNSYPLSNPNSKQKRHSVPLTASDFCTCAVFYVIGMTANHANEKSAHIAAPARLRRRSSRPAAAVLPVPARAQKKPIPVALKAKARCGPLGGWPWWYGLGEDGALPPRTTGLPPRTHGHTGAIKRGAGRAGRLGWRQAWAIARAWHLGNSGPRKGLVD